MRAILKERTKRIHDEVESLPFQKVLTNKNRFIHPQLLRDHIEHKILYLGTLERLITEKEQEHYFQSYKSLTLPSTSTSTSTSISSPSSPPPLSPPSPKNSTSLSDDPASSASPPKKRQKTVESSSLPTQRPSSLTLLIRFLKTLFRHSQLLKSAEYLDSHHNTVKPSNEDIPPSVHEYVSYLENLSRSHPIYLIFHAWVNLCDGLFGGVIIANSIRHRLGDGADAFFRYPDILDSKLDFKRALEKVNPLFLTSFQEPLQAHPWTEDETTRAVEEATKAFEFVGKIATSMESSPYYQLSTTTSSVSVSASTSALGPHSATITSVSSASHSTGTDSPIGVEKKPEEHGVLRLNHNTSNLATTTASEQ